MIPSPVENGPDQPLKLWRKRSNQTRLLWRHSGYSARNDRIIRLQLDRPGFPPSPNRAHRPSLHEVWRVDPPSTRANDLKLLLGGELCLLALQRFLELDLRSLTSFEPHFRTISLVELPATDMLPRQ